MLDVKSPCVAVAAERNLARGGDRLDARQRAQPRDELVGFRRDRFVLRVRLPTIEICIVST